MRLKPTKIVYDPLPSDDFLPAKITKIEDQDESDSKYGKAQFKFEFTVVVDGEDKKVSHWTDQQISSSDSKKPNKLRVLIDAADPGAIDEVEENDEEYDVDDLIGKKIRIMMEEPVKDKFQKISTIRAFKKSAAEKKQAEADDDEEEAPKPKAKKRPADDDDEPAPKAKKKAAPVDDDEDDEDRPAPKTARKKLNYKK